MSGKLRGAQKDRGSVWRAMRITFLRGLLPGAAVPLAAAVGLSGCAPARPPVSQPQTAAAAAPVAVGRAYATVAAVRPIANYGPAGSNPDAAILPAMGLSASPGVTRGAMSEIVVRTDGGETLSVVQPVAALVPGERVMVLPAGSGRRLVPVPPQS